jgi:hypothetical protein
MRTPLRVGAALMPGTPNQIGVGPARETIENLIDFHCGDSEARLKQGVHCAPDFTDPARQDCPIAGSRPLLGRK